jgi:hypothetical protein
MGLEVRNGATPAAMNTANANGTTAAGMAGYSPRTSPTITGVSTRIAASLLNTEAVAKPSPNTNANSRVADTPAAGTTRMDSCWNSPTRVATPVITMIEASATSGRHSVCHAMVRLAAAIVPASSRTDTPSAAAAAGPIRRPRGNGGLRSTKPSVTASAETATAVSTGVPQRVRQSGKLTPTNGTTTIKTAATTRTASPRPYRPWRHKLSHSTLRFVGDDRLVNDHHRNPCGACAVAWSFPPH